MRSHRLVAAVTLAALVTPVGFGALQARAAESVTSARVSPALTDQLAVAAPTAVLRVLVNAVDLDSALTAARATGMTVLTTFDRVGVAVAAGTAEQVRSVAAIRGVETVEWADEPITLDQETSHQATRAEQAAQTFTAPTEGAYDGTGIGIMIMDGGVDGTHPMFRRADGSSKVKRNLETVPLGYSIVDPSVIDDPDGDNNTDDVGGHGTHVASIAAGSPVVTGRGNTIVGAAPGADLYAISNSTAGSTLYGLTAGTNWTVEHHAEPCGPDRPDCAPIRVVNNSWGGAAGEEFDEDATFVQMQRALLADGVVVVRSTGNSGGDGSSSTMTGGYKIDPRPGVITVANYDDAGSGTRDGTLNSSSSRGDKTKINTWPDLAAPGTEIDGACRAHHTACSPAYATIETDPEYGELTGTSMAAPHVTGYVALLLQADPTLTPAEVEYVLEDTAYRFEVDGGYTSIPSNLEAPDGHDGLSHYAAGHGLVDVTAALAAVLAETDPGYPNGCSAYTVVTDPSGDGALVASLVEPGIAEGTPDPSVDIVAVTARQVDGRIRVAIEVDDMGDLPLANGDAVRSFFSVGSIAFTLDMNRQATSAYAPAGTLSRPDPADPTGVQNIVVDRSFPVVFDPVTDLAYADLDASILGDGSPIAAGDSLGGLRTLWRRSGGAVAIPADEAKALCGLLITG